MSRAVIVVKDAVSGLSRKVHYVGFDKEADKIRFEVCDHDGWHSEALPIDSDRIVLFNWMLVDLIYRDGGHTGKVRCQVSDFLWDGCIKEYTEKYPEVNWQIL